MMLQDLANKISESNLPEDEKAQLYKNMMMSYFRLLADGSKEIDRLKAEQRDGEV